MSTNQSSNKKLGKQTNAIHFGYDKDSQQTMSVPIYQTTAYAFDSSLQASNRFSLQELGNIYSRLTNPTCDVLEKRLSVLEGGAASIVTASGSAALFYAITNLAGSGDNVLVANKIYGGSTTLLFHTLKRFGIKAIEFDIDDLSTLESKIDSKTKAIFFETLSNPQIAVADIEALTSIAKKHKVITIADNTVATPILCNPFKHGVDVITHSLSKYISGQGSVLAGAVIEREGLNELIKDNPRYAHFNEPDSSYHGLVYTSVPLPNYTLRIRIALLRDIGATLSAFNAWLVIQGLETLALRIKKHSKNALKIAKFLASHPKVESVSYPALESDRYHALAKKYFYKSYSSGLVSFVYKGSEEETRKVVDSTSIFSIVVNIGDTKSLIVHPASTTHSQLSESELKEVGILPNLIRLSIGIEDFKDLKEDLEEALGK
ncbi:O-acetylhomoserine aminocarboxypropyltransferase/cysteine synthase family protein [Helicobacter sp. 11S02629-2]|uniref:O-acetylhomoserine aminocarboxypropyltransferase/cysteine synthase family protein n=1 Tax=Helicobacter sp. 11S02629-2 TaxID=1476195 RepID=UPI000BA70C71|nr:O-acetylhomoserine aminocarboxypropyltransferase/cysteine synthase family protein [Helicobacter sp. 11S02629-2]PAF45701.1 O-acetylhomoserine aminocarboxypropyltransferase [Helicobacter sp. 11S02629-2]